ncbi:DUF2510 domain-containing protein [Kitasatospora sp. NPDC004531]
MSEQQIPAGWYPDPVDTDSDPRPERWWDGKGWTASTRPASAAPDAAPGGPSAAPADAAPGTPADAPGTPADAAPGAEHATVLEGTVLDAAGHTVHYPPPPPYAGLPPAKPRRRPSKPVVIAASVAALLGLGLGSGVTYLAMDGHSGKHAAAKSSPENRPGHKGEGFDGENGENGENGGSGGSGKNGKNGPGDGIPGLPGQGEGKNGKGDSDGVNADLAVDLVNGISLPIPSGWQGGTTKAGFAALSIGEYTCAGSSSDTCSLGGADSSRINGTDAKQAAQQDIEAAAKAAYGDITGHQELKNEAVTVAGRAGHLVRWKVDAPKGNNGYVETVVFPTADGKALTAVHLGFDIADKAPGLDQMDAIVKGIATFKGGPLGTGTTT